MGIFKDLKLFFNYRRNIRKNRVELLSKFNMRIDNADRMYTVLNIPEDIFDEPYNIRKEDIDSIAQTYVREYVSKLSEYLNSIGVSELYSFYEPIRKVEKYSYLIILGYRQLDSVEINKIIYRIFLPILIVGSLLSTIIYLFSH